MDHKKFIEIINENKLESSYLFIGDEEYLMNQAIQLLKSTYIDDNFETLNFTQIDGKDRDFDSLVNACETLPFMSSKKIVILKDIAEFFEDDNLNFRGDIYKYFDDLDNYLCLILLDNTTSLKKTTKIYRHFKKKGRVVEFTKLKGKDVNLWVENILKKHGLGMSYSNINYFVQQSSYLSRNLNYTLYDLENELLKIISYVKKGEITKEIIDLVLTKSIDSNIFDLLGAINEGNSDRALRTFHEIYMTNEPIPKILVMISRQVRLILTYKLYREKGYTDGEILDKLNIKSYEFSKISAQSRKFNIKKLEYSLEEILATDKKIKTTSGSEKLFMEMLIVNLCNGI